MNVFCSTYASEIIRCQLQSKKDLLIHTKYSSEVEPWGHHRGIEYEGMVYESVLRNIEVTSPKFYGVYKDIEDANDWLLIEHIDHALRLYTSTESMITAAHWLGRFHSINKPKINLPEMNFLASYDSNYFNHWIGRTSEYAYHLGSDFLWVNKICDYLLERIDSFANSEFTVTHGEFYPKNILIKENNIYPVDWESAVITRGEIDLASLIEGWDRQTIADCKKAYCEARWLDDVPDDFESVFNLALLFWPLRWLGDRDEFEMDEFASKYFERLDAETRRQNLL